MKRSSRSRKIGISGLLTAPMRMAARWRAVNCHQLGSCQETTSPGPTPSAASAAAMRSTRAASSP